MSRYIILSILLAVWGIIPAFPQGDSGNEELPRPVTQEYRIEIGGGSALSTYLSPLRYAGRALAVTGSWTKASQWAPESLVMRFDASLGTRTYHNPAHTASMIGFNGMFGWGMAWRKRLPHSLQLTAGGMLDVNGGCLYLPRNGNNPVSVLASASFDLTASLSWRFNIGKLPMILSDEVRLPSLGCFFSPAYGETYYEIWLGNHNGLAHCGWWGNRFCLDNLLKVSLDFGRTAMEVGYRYDCDTSWTNRLNTQLHTHYFVIGIIPHGVGIKRKARINSALY